jgi:hypothetical protein
VPKRLNTDERYGHAAELDSIGSALLPFLSGKIMAHGVGKIAIVGKVQQKVLSSGAVAGSLQVTSVGCTVGQ